MKSGLYFLCLAVAAQAWHVSNTYVGNSFFDGFDFWTYSDPTHGFVNFVDENTARSQGMVWTNDNYVYMGADHTNNAPNGRNSVRIQSQASWNYGLFVLIMDHMPGGQCGTWPAFWTVGGNWPNEGEIDIIEGVNTNSVNQMTLHSGSGCQMEWSGRNETGKIISTDCDAYVNSNSGCAVLTNQANSYGEDFSNNGGGAYAMQYFEDGVRIWFFPANNMPWDIASDTPNPLDWPVPDAFFPFGGDCSSNHFGPQQIVFDLTFCGDWAGSAYQYSGCPSNCNDFVANNPSAFQGYYWGIKSLKVYQ
eukprot:TRINITY_DN21828_c0_g1_i1.p1 TRINITY_DN21828_c0_g1~~TRINITY_DN21828_c0_g1_i1.p1  ORF type:complete len:305 (+),score=58.16 TRINITY_DN21828_c0_g1_i1:66-980(+)